MPCKNGRCVTPGKIEQHAVENLPALRGTLLVGITDGEFGLLRKACELHTVCHDRLDLMRVGITPNPKKMATERGAFYAANMGQFYADTGTREEKYFFDE